MKRVGILCPKCGLHAMRTVRTCRQVAEHLETLGPAWRAEVECATRDLRLPKDCSQDDLARGYALEP